MRGEGEELEELPQTEMERDPLRRAKVKVGSGGEVCFGYVEDIEVGKTTGERVYLIRYLDGDVQHMTEQQVRSMQIDENLDPDGVDSEEDSDDDGAAAYNEALAEEDEDRKKLGALYLEVRLAALETIARVDAKGKITAEDIFNNVLDMSTWIEHRATEQYEMMVVRHAIGQAIQEAVSTGIIVSTVSRLIFDSIVVFSVQFAPVVGRHAFAIVTTCLQTYVWRCCGWR